MLSHIVTQFSKVLTLETVGFGIIPLGVMLVSWGLQKSYNMRLNSGAELFAFTFALDLNLLMDQSNLSPKMNPLLLEAFGRIFVVILLISVGMLIFATKTQSRIYENIRLGYYPYMRVSLCWVLGIVIIAFHLFALLGK